MVTVARKANEGRCGTLARSIMSSVRVSSSSTAHGTKLPPICVRTNPPPPQQWTMVKEYSMEKRENFQDWQVNAAFHLKRMRDQLISYSDFINMMDDEIRETKKQWITEEKRDEPDEDNNNNTTNNDKKSESQSKET